MCRCMNTKGPFTSSTFPRFLLVEYNVLHTPFRQIGHPCYIRWPMSSITSVDQTRVAPTVATKSPALLEVVAVALRGEEITTSRAWSAQYKTRHYTMTFYAKFLITRRETSDVNARILSMNTQVTPRLAGRITH
jgi:hypothetical protein